MRSTVVGKPKFHLCVSVNGLFLFLNSYKGRDYAGNIVVPCAELPFLSPTPTGKSVICCSMVLRLSPTEQRGAIVKGRVSRELLIAIVKEVEDSEVLSAVDQEALLEGLGDWL